LNRDIYLLELVRERNRRKRAKGKLKKGNKG
jgi:hypothetical protein